LSKKRRLIESSVRRIMGKPTSSRTNPVAKFAKRFNKAGAFKDRKREARKYKARGKNKCVWDLENEG